jgi:acetylornithine/succinyldiaminopimelate/putrescine aminotransferase
VLEPVLGEGGIHPLASEFLTAARELADAHRALLLFDEVQCGVGRTGTFFAWQRSGVRPDAVTLAKSLANGLPIGALLVADEAAGAFEPGDHASTFGGNPVACAAAAAVCETIDDELLANVDARGAALVRALEALPAVREVRGAGLLLGAELDRAAGGVVEAALARGLVVGTAGETVLRLTPPLTIDAADVERALAALEEVLA